MNTSEYLAYKNFTTKICRLAKELPQLQLCDNEMLDALKTKMIDFQMAEEDNLPTKMNVDSFWASMHQLASAMPMYPNLLTLVIALLSLPASNSDSECCFSMVQKIDSQERSQLEYTTVAANLSMKLNIDNYCQTPARTSKNQQVSS